MSKNYYPEMLDKLLLATAQKIPNETIIHWLLQHRPHSFIQAIKAIEAENKPATVKEPSYIQTCRDLIKRERFFEAMDHWRKITKQSQLEAKDSINALRQEMGV